MCYAKPGPRCSGHSLTRWEAASDVAARTGTLDDRMAALVAEDTFDTTPKGQQRLKDMIAHPSTTKLRQVGLEGRLQAAQERRRQQAAAYRDITGKSARADTLGLGDQDTLPPYAPSPAAALADTPEARADTLKDTFRRLVAKDWDAAGGNAQTYMESRSARYTDVNNAIYSSAGTPEERTAAAQEMCDAMNIASRERSEETGMLEISEVDAWHGRVELHTQTFVRLDNAKGVYVDYFDNVRVQTDRPLTAEETGRLAQLTGYAATESMGRGEGMGLPRSDSDRSIILSADVTKYPGGHHVGDFPKKLQEVVRDGSPLRTTNRAGEGTKGTRLVDGIADVKVTLWSDAVNYSTF